MERDDVVIEADGSEELGRDDAEAASGKVAKQKGEIEQLRKEKQEYLDGWQRAKADYVNALKRFDEEKKAAIELGKVITVGAFLPVMDSLTRAEAAGDIPDAFQGIAKQLHTAAHALSLIKIGEIGETFDPMLHEALGQDPTEDRSKDDTVSAVLEPGWKSKEAVIRPAKVRVFHAA
jgi:molecular chaperone GrpE